MKVIRLYSFFAATAALLLAGCAADKTKAAGPPPAVPVTVATVEQKTVPVTLQGIGSAQPFSTVGIRSQVGDPDTRLVDKGQTTIQILTAANTQTNVASAQPGQ